MNDPLLHVSELVRLESGLALGPHHRSALQAAIGRIAPGLDAAAVARASAEPAGRARLMARLIDEVTVKETYFMRHPDELETIDWGRLLEGAQRRGDDRIRVWNPACATGEEPYSLAMLALQALGARAGVSILATDIAPSALAHAEVGRYRAHSLRQLPTPLRERHLGRDASGLSIAPAVRELVRFTAHNLAAGPFPPTGAGRFDLVVCRNVLMYFEAPTVLRALAGLRASLAPGGVLLLGAADRVSVTAAGVSEGVAPRAAAGVDPAPEPSPTAPGQDSAAAPAAPPVMGQLADPLDADVHFRCGLSRRDDGDMPAAVAALRRACYLDPAFAWAAFELGRAYEALQDHRAARRSYRLALAALNRPGAHEQRLLAPDEVEAIGLACAQRLGRLSPPRTVPQ